MKETKMKLSDLRKLDRDDLLRLIGLEERTPAGDVLGGLGLFAVGMLVGAGLGLLFAPKRGEEIRGQMGDIIRRRGRQAEELGERFGAEAGVTSQTPGSPMTGGPPVR
jgi:hypothetical protein